MAPLGDQAQGEMGQRKGLPGAGTGLQQAKTRIQRIAVGVKALGHGAILNGVQRRGVAGCSCCRIGP